MTRPETKNAVVLAGGSGLIGRRLAKALGRRGYRVIILTRRRDRSQASEDAALWDGQSLGPWTARLEAAHAVVNLAGRSINCRPTQENRRQVLESRVQATRALGRAIAQAETPPRAWIQCSGVGIYGPQADAWLTESAPAGDGYPANVCAAWEQAQIDAATPEVRKAVLRIGLALDRDGGVLATLESLTRLFLGGAGGSGRQYMSWIHIDDLVAMFVRAVEDQGVSGAYNATAPHPVTNAEFMRALRRALRRPWCPPAPAIAARIGAWIMGSDPTLALTGCRCQPKRFQDQDFSWRHETLQSALNDLYGVRPGSRAQDIPDR